MENLGGQIKKIGEEINKSKISVRILSVLGALILIKLIYLAGVSNGYHRASQGFKGMHYSENFGIGRRNIRLAGINSLRVADYFPNSHGASGRITKIEGDELSVQDKDNTEKLILINGGTKIEKGSADILPADLRANDFIVALGTPNREGLIEAKLIRLIPEDEFPN